MRLYWKNVSAQLFAYFHLVGNKESLCNMYRVISLNNIRATRSLKWKPLILLIEYCNAIRSLRANMIYYISSNPQSITKILDTRYALQTKQQNTSLVNMHGLHNADSSIELLDIHTTQTQTGEVRCTLQWSLSCHQHVCIRYFQEDTTQVTYENLKWMTFPT